jgi:AraC-like DNA-binding protein
LLAIICGAWLVNATFHLFDVHEQLPHLNKLHIPFVCLSGTSWYMYVKCLLGKHTFRTQDSFHLLPAALCILLGLPFYLESAEFKLNYVETELNGFASILMYIASRVSELNSFVYLILTHILIYRELASANNIDNKKTYLIVFYITIIAIFTLLLRTIGSVFNMGFIGIALPSVIIFILFSVLYSFGYYNPSLLGISELKKSKRKSKAKNHSVAIDEQMTHYKKIIERDKVYLDSNISLTELARHLNTQPYILSEIINVSMNTNFNTFINRLRIEHASSLLIQEDNKSVLDIAYASGFNSKSVFYKYFSEVKSMTPVQYRRMYSKKNGEL